MAASPETTIQKAHRLIDQLFPTTLPTVVALLERIDELETRVFRSDHPDDGSEPTPTQVLAARIPDAPCAINGCAGTCNAAWVGFSIRRYGVPLCGKHSALAKRGEIDAELERLNTPREIAS